MNVAEISGKRKNFLIIFLSKLLRIGKYHLHLCILCCCLIFFTKCMVTKQMRIGVCILVLFDSERNSIVTSQGYM